MKTMLKKTLTTLAFALGLTTFAFGEEMYYNRLSMGDVVIPAGTYGDIVVPGNGYCATKFPSSQATITEAPGDFGGSYADIISHIGDDTDIRTHTISGWFKQNTNATTYALLFAPRSQNSSSSSNGHTGYKASLWKTGVLQVGKVKGNLTWNDTDGAHRNSTEKLPINEWFYFTLAITHSDSARKFTAQAFVNGVSLPMQEGEIAGNLNGTSCIQILMGDNVECAGFRVDDTAVTDPTTMKSWATNETYVKAFVPRKDYAATISTTEPTDITALGWEPAMPAGGFDAGANLTITATADAVVSVANDLTAKSITFVSEANSIAMTKDEAATVAVESFDFAEVAGLSTLGFDAGAASIVAGVDTTIESLGGNATIGEDMRLTVKGGAFNASWVTNAGTLNFLGGEEGEPISILGDANLGKVTLGEDTFVKFDDDGTTRLYDVTGSGASSVFTIARKAAGNAGVKSGSSFANVMIESIATGTGNNSMWVENSTIAETVGLKLTGAIMVQKLTPSPVVFRGLSGAGNLTHYDSTAIVIRSLEDNDYAGKCALALTIGEGTGTQTLSGAYTGALTINEGGKAKISGDANPRSIVNNGTLGIDFAERYTLPNDNDGTIDLYDGDLLVMDGTKKGTINLLGTGKVLDGLYVTINNCGTFTVPDGYEPENVRLFYPGGAAVNNPVVSGRTITFDWDITDGACWWDYEFEGDLKSTGADTTALGHELTDPYFNAESNALRVGYSTSYRSVSAYPEEFTAVLYGKIVDQTNHVEMGFGSSTAGSKISVAIACGDPTAEEVRLVIAEGSTAKKIVSMSVPNAYKADHLYAFVCQTVGESEDAKTKVTVYLDGIEWDSYTFDTKITLGAGFQIGSVHGGIPSGCVKANTDDKNAYLDFLRTYNVALNGEAMKRYAAEYPYESENGKATRTFSGETTWVADGWTQKIGEESYATNCPLPSTMIEVTASAAATVEMNLGEQANYESFTAQGAGSLTLGAGGMVEPTVSGLTTIGTDVTVDYNAIKFGKTIILAGKTLTFDFADFPIGTIFANTSYEVTGAVTLGDGAKVESANLPSSTEARTVTFGLNEYGHYALTITVDKTIPFVYTIAEEGEGVWTWDKQIVDEATVLAMSKATIEKAGTGTQQFVGASKFDYTVAEGMLQFTNDANNATSTITINEGATFDMNGLIDSMYNIVLKGGTLANYGAPIANNVKQLTGITLTADSYIDSEKYFCMISKDYAENVIDLGGCTLTKKGAEHFLVYKTTVTNGVLRVTEGQFRINAIYASYVSNVRFIDATLELLGGSAYIGSNKTLTIGEITGDDGLIENVGTLSPCTLKGTLTLTGKGTWNTNTLDNATVTLDAGCKRGLAFAGSGTVNAVLTAAEIAKEGPITVFTATEGATVTGGTVVDEDGNVVPGSFTDGSFQVDHEAKIGTKYYLTLQDALDVGGDVTLLTLVTGEYTIAEGKTVNLDLGVYSITAKAGRQAINNYGTLTINNGAVTAGEAAIVLWGGSTTTINGGSYQSTDNAVIMGSGNDGEGNVSLTINGGLFTGGITTAGYIACGVYVPNSGTYAIKGGTFAITGGCGVCARAGTTKIDSGVVFNVTGSGTGKVGDKGGVPAGVDVFFDYSEPAYPGYAEGDAIFAQSTALKTADGQGWFGPEENYYKLAKTDTAEAKIGDVYYATLQDALDVGGDVKLLTLVTGEYTIAAGKTVNLDLGGYSITANAGRQAINNYGTLTINNGAVTAGEAAIVLWGNSVTTIEGGSYQSTDNAVIMGSGNDGEGNVSLTINGGLFTGGITTAGYIACGVYVPNSGTYAIKGGQFNITGGCGVCARAGTTKIDSGVTFNVTGTGKGKVGDKGGVPAGVDVFFDWSDPAYPGYAEGDTIWSQSNELSTDAEQEWSKEAVEGYYALQVKSPIQPVEPGQEIDVPTGADPEKFVAGVEANKATLLKAPENVLSGTELTAYQTLFTATLSPEGTTVNFELNETGTNTVEVKTAEAKTDALDVALSEESELTISEPLPGFYYSLKQGGDVKDLGFNDPGDQDKLAGKVDIKFNLVKPENAGFYQTIITPTPTK